MLFKEFTFENDCSGIGAPPLEKEEVHLFHCRLDLTEKNVSRMEKICSKQERGRAARFHFDVHRCRYLAMHGMLRYILGYYLGLTPDAVSFFHGERGKPELAEFARGQAELRFNLSHSNGRALLGLTLSRAIGVDIEHVRVMDNLLQLAASCFSSRERRELNFLPAEQRHTAFFNGWTRKEAYLKATGEGLAGLERVETTILPEAPATLLKANGSRAEATRWLVFSLKPALGYIGAVVVEKEPGSIYPNEDISC